MIPEHLQDALTADERRSLTEALAKYEEQILNETGLSMFEDGFCRTVVQSVKGIPGYKTAVIQVWYGTEDSMTGVTTTKMIAERARGGDWQIREPVAGANI